MILYVSDSGNDTNDGLSWATAKLTVMAAYDSLPVTGGTIFISGDLVSATSTVGEGLWLMGSGDPNYGTPPTGWRKLKTGPIAFIGVGGKFLGTNGHAAPRVGLNAGSAVDRNHPGIWLSSCQSTVRFENLNIQYPGRGVVVGEDSNNVRTGASGQCAGVTFENVNANIPATVGMGPGWDITNQCFWIYCRNCGGAGNQAVNGSLDDKSAAFLCDATNGLIFLLDCNTQNGGVKIKPGPNGTTNFVVERLTTESMIGPTAPDYVGSVWVTATSAFDSYHFSDIQTADAVGNVCGVLIGGSGPQEAVSAEDIYGGCIGPMLVRNQYPINVAHSQSTLAVRNQSGFSNGRLSAQVDAARREFVPSLVRFKNLCNQGNALWYHEGGTIVGGQTGPDGSILAQKLTGLGVNIVYPYYVDNHTIAAGDYFIYGIWTKASPGGFGGACHVTLQVLGNGNMGQSLWGVLNQGSTGFSLISPEHSSGDGDWRFYFIATKVLVAGTPSASIRAQITQSGGYDVYAHSPIVLHIPAGTITDNEAAEIAQNLITWPDNAAIGDIAVLRGHTFNAPRLRASLGTAYSGADAAIILSSGWGSTGAVSSARGYDQALSFTVTPNGSGIAPNPTITINFKDGAWTAIPQFAIIRNDTNAPFGTPPHVVALTATSMTITFIGTPVVGTSYQYLAVGMGN